MDLDQYLRFLIALAFVLAVIFALAWVAKRLGYGTAASRRLRPGRRLAIVEVLAVDARRNLILVRRDDKEHLLLLGPTQDCVVEGPISAAEGSATEIPGVER